MRVSISKAVAGCAMVLSCQASWAGDPPASLEQLLNTEVEGASRFSQPLAEAPAAVGVLSAEDIRHYGFRTLGEALQGMRGVYTSDERDYSYVGIRGFARPGDYNTRMLLLTDGIRRNDPLYDSAAIGHDAPIEIDWVKRLEFVPGPSSALYGQNAIFGVANAVMWSGADLDGTRIRADIGSGDMARVGLLSGRALESGGDWLFGVSAYGRRGANLYFPAYDNPAGNDGWARGRDGERYLKAIAKFSGGNWQADAGYSTRRKDVPTGYWGTQFNAPGTFVDDTWAYADVSHFNAFSPAWSANLRVRAGEYRFTGQYAYAGLDNRDEARATWLGLDYLLTYTGLPDHKLLFGAEAQNNLHLEQRNFDMAPRVDHLDDRRRGTSSGIFAQDEWRFDSRWMANLGVRADHIAGSGAVSPRLALIHQLQPAATLKLIYGRSFRAPNAYERYYSDGNVTTRANPEVGLERITMQEAVADFALSPTLRLSGSYYHYRLDNLIEQVTDAGGLLVFVNRPAVHAHGVEIEAETILAGALHVRGSVAAQHLAQSFGTAPNSPRLLGKLLADGPLFSTGWTLGLNVQGMGSRYGGSDAVAGHTRANLVMRRQAVRSEGEWSVGIYNLFGRRYFDPASAGVAGGAVVQDGRQLRLGWEIAY